MKDDRIVTGIAVDAAQQGHGWEHLQCPRCWLRESRLRRPHRLADSPRERCCYCGNDTTAGIWRRVRPGTAALRHCPDLQLDVTMFVRQPE